MSQVILQTKIYILFQKYHIVEDNKIWVKVVVGQGRRRWWGTVEVKPKVGGGGGCGWDEEGG